MFKTVMTRTAGGFTITSVDSIRHYFSNLTLGGYAKIGKDGEGNVLILENAFEAAISMDLLGPSYAAITGHYPDGSLSTPTRKVVARSRSHPWEDSPAVLRGLLASSDGTVSYFWDKLKERAAYRCHKGGTLHGHSVANRVGIMRQVIAWSVQCLELDHIIIQRLKDLTSYDLDMIDRIKSLWELRRTDHVNEGQVLATQKEKAEAQIRRLDKLLTDPEIPLNAATEKRYLEMLHEAESDLERLMRKQTEQKQKLREDPTSLISNFYQVLSHLPEEFQHLTPENQKRIARQVIKEVKLNRLTSHLFLQQIEWQNDIATCPDVSIVWRGTSPNNGDIGTTNEDASMKRLYAEASQLEIMQALPERAWNRMLERAQILGIHRAIKHTGRKPLNIYHRTMCHSDLEAITTIGRTPEQKEHLRKVANNLAKRTVRGGMTAHWWLPLDVISYAGNPNSLLPTESELWNFSDFAYEWHHRA